MSLLIDALKQAEAQRQQPQAKDDDKALSLSPLDPRTPNEGQAAAPPQTASSGTAHRRASGPAPTERSSAQAASRDLFQVKHSQSQQSPVVWIGAAALALFIAGAIYVWLQIQPPKAPSVSAHSSPRPAEPDRPPPRQRSEVPVSAALISAEAMSVPTDTAPSVQTMQPTSPPPVQSRVLRNVPTDGIRVHTPTASSKPSSPPALPSLAAGGKAPTPAADGINFQRSGAPQVSSTNLRAYEAYQRDDLTLAAQLYREALRSEPKNTDILNALGLLAMRAGQFDHAERYFQQALTINPKDSQAASQLALVYGDGDPLAAESRLRNLIANHPGSAEANFALGSLLSKQKRWREAQPLFFQAHTLDPGNADILFNLAVCLDRLQQASLALQYYEHALAAQQKRPAGFNIEALKRRVQSLQTSLHATAAPAAP